MLLLAQISRALKTLLHPAEYMDRDRGPKEQNGDHNGKRHQDSNGAGNFGVRNDCCRLLGTKE